MALTFSRREHEGTWRLREASGAQPEGVLPGLRRQGGLLSRLPGSGEEWGWALRGEDHLTRPQQGRDHLQVCAVQNKLPQEPQEGSREASKEARNLA